MNKKLAIVLMFFTYIPFFVFANAQPEITINLYNQQVYYDDSEVSIQIRLCNTGINPITFKLADQRVHNIKLNIRTLTNDSVPESDQSIKEFISSQPIYYTEIRLKPSEEFNFIVKLSDFVDIKSSGDYFIQAAFYKGFRTAQETPILSNSIEIELLASGTEDEEIQVAIQPELIENKSEPLYPDEVVKWTIAARQENNWEKYFQYLDLEKLYLKSSNNKQGYLALSETARKNKIEEYKSWLIEGSQDKDLLLIPTHYEIIKTSFTENNAVVIVYQEFNNGRFIDKKQYSYFLQKFDQLWKIYDYAIINVMGSK